MILQLLTNKKTKNRTCYIVGEKEAQGRHVALTQAEYSDLFWALTNCPSFTHQEVFHKDALIDHFVNKTK